MKSMTAYAYLDSVLEGAELSCELKSYNSRFLDLNIAIPSWMNQLEPFLRRYFTRRITRGKVEFYLRVKTMAAHQRIAANIPLAEAYYQSMQSVAKALGMESQLTLDLIIRQEGVLQFERYFDETAWKAALHPVLDALFGKFNAARIAEGQALYTDMQKMIAILTAAVNDIKTNAAQMEHIFSTMLKKKCTDLMEHEPDPQRLLQEIALLLVKYTINEEIIRTNTHIEALQKELLENETPGKKIDFLCQEINREINTIGSKNQLPAIGQAVIAAKHALENIREQAHNIE